MNVAYATKTTAETVYYAVVTRNRIINRDRPEVIVEQSLAVAARRGMIPDVSGALWVRFDDGSKLLWHPAEGFGHSRNDPNAGPSKRIP